MRVEIIPNFATQEELNALNEWVTLGVKNKWLDCGFNNSFNPPTDKRLTTRMYGNRFEYPSIVYELAHRINRTVGLEGYKNINGHGKDGIVVSYTMDGGDVFKHKDCKSDEGISTLRCNILSQAPKEGGRLYIEDVPVQFNTGDLHCYLASEHEHYATPVKGNIPRIMWMFGAHVPAEDWNSEKIKVQQ